MHYIYLFGAIIFEVVGTSVLNVSEGFSKMLPAVCSLLLYGASLFCLSRALTQIDLGIAYATWCSVGMTLTAIISVVVFGQKISPIGIVSVIIIMVGCIMLNLYGTVK